MTDSPAAGTATAPAPGDVVVLVGNPRPRSRTGALAEQVASTLAPGATAHLIDLAEQTELLGAPLGADSARRWAAPLDRLLAARLLVVATPTYKGSYTGLLKAFLDHVDAGALRRAVAVPVTTVGGPAHTLAADVHLRPLLLELGASTPTSSVVVGGPDLDDPAAAVRAWALENAAPLALLAPLLRGVPA